MIFASSPPSSITTFVCGIYLSGLNELAKGYQTIYPIASRCGVFAKTDVQPLLNEGATVFNNDAIWSKNAPVPPAHVPFIRCSTDLPK